jgi:hypothetical protein
MRIQPLRGAPHVAHGLEAATDGTHQCPKLMTESFGFGEINTVNALRGIVNGAEIPN